jgi:hypothetical protein
LRPGGHLSFQATIIQLRNFLALAQPASAEDLNVVWGAGPQPWLQSSLTEKYYEREAARVRAAAAAAPGSDAATMLVFDAALGYAGGAFLRAVPAGWAGALTAEELEATLRRRSRLPFPQLRAGNVRCVCCGQLMDVFGDHAEACRVHGGKHDWAAHNRVRDALAACAREAGLLPETEKPALVEGTRERPADVYLPAEGRHGLGGAASAGLGACVDVVGVRTLAPSAVVQGLAPPLEEAERRKLRRVFEPSATASAAAARAAATAAAAALLAGADDAELERARREAHARTIGAFAPRWFVVPFAFSSLGCLAAGAEVVMRTMAARSAASEAAGGAEGAGHGVLHARWLPRLSAAIERGAWRRLRPLLRGASGVAEGDVLVASELVCASRFLHLSSTDARGAG